MLLKVDLAKAFDSVARPFLLEVLDHAGFPERWREWIAFMLRTASTKVITNGRPGPCIHHARGLRQGDPFSPLLFVIVMEVLNMMIAEADRRGALAPLPGNAIKFHALVYADDLVVFLAPTTQDFRCIREILQLFAGTSGLQTNLDKCQVTPIRCSDNEVAAVAVQQVFPCQIQQFPCTYLGAPLSLSCLRRADEQRLVDKVAARIPTWKAGMLNAAGRTTLTQTTLSAIPVHISITCCLSAWAINEIDKRCRAFL